MIIFNFFYFSTQRNRSLRVSVNSLMIQSLLYESLKKVEEIAVMKKQETNKKQEMRDANRLKEAEICMGYQYIRQLDEAAALYASKEFFSENQEDDIMVDDSDQDYLVEEILGVKISKYERNNTPLPLTAIEASRCQVQG